MNETEIDDLSLEPERYELQAEIAERWEAARAEFFAAVGGNGNGLVVVFALEEVSARTEGGGRRGGPGLSLPQEIGFWLHVSDTGQVTGYTGKVEVGQNIRTTLTQIITDELPVPFDSIRLVMADTDLSPFDMGTVGSRSTPITVPQVRAVAAGARVALREIAARKGTAAGEPDWDIAALLQGEAILRVADSETPTKPPTEWRILGSPAPRANGRALVTGGHRYTSDLRMPNGRWGAVLRAPSWNARRVSLDTTVAEAIPGVVVVRDGDFVGAVAGDAETAVRAVAAMKAEWEPAADLPTSDTLYDYLRSHPADIPAQGAPVPNVEGSVADGFARADQILESTYTVAYIAHAPLETRAAVAEWTGEKLTVWTGTQRPFGVRTELAETFGISEDRIRVIVPDTGSGYGGKHIGDAAIEAARLARGANVPVKLVWSREEEFTHAYFRPAGVIDIQSGVRADGEITAWEHHNYNSGGSAIRTPYRVANQHSEFHPSRSPLRQGSYRALAATANHFARESHLDELAHLLGMDPLALRLRNLDDSGDDRLRAVLVAAASRFGWDKTPSPGHGFGIAGGHEKGSYVATCAEVTVAADGTITVVRAVTAFECGAVHHADNVRNQVEGAVIMGLGGALFERIRFAGGRIENPCFSRYRIPRFGDIPTLETVLLDRQDLPSVGAGETPIVAIAPAIGNAVFAATGVRRRSLPFA